MAKLLMPKATAVWLIENTALSFKQIAEFCSMHELEVQGIADGEVASGMQGLDPVLNGETTKEAIEASEADPNLPIEVVRMEMPKFKQKGPKYTPLSKRQDKPDAIAWIIKFYPKLTDQHIIKLIGTTKSTIQSIRDRSHWNSPNIKPRDPVLLGLCRQSELNKLLEKTGSLEDTPPHVMDDMMSPPAPAKKEDEIKDASYYFSDIGQSDFNTDTSKEKNEGSENENPFGDDSLDKSSSN